MSKLLPFWLLLVFACTASAVRAQDAGTLNLDLVNQRINTLKANGAEDSDEQVVAYSQVRTLLTQASGYDTDYDGYVQALSDAPRQTEAIQDQLDELDDGYDPTKEIAELAPDELSAQLALKRSERDDLSDQLAALDRRLAARESNASNLRARLAEIEQRIDELAGQPLTVAVGAAPALSEAQQWRDAAEAMALRAEQRAKEAQLASQPARYALLSAQRAQMAVTLEHLDELLQALQARVASAAGGATFKVDVGVAADDPAFPVAQTLAKKQVDARRDQARIAAELSDVRSLIEENRRLSRMIDDRFATARRVVDFAGNSEVLGEVLLSYWEEVNELNLTTAPARFSSAVGSVVISRVEHEDVLSQLSSAPKFVNRTLREAGIDPDGVSDVTRGALLELARGYRDSLRTLIASESEYISTLSTAQTDNTEVAEKTAQYREFLEALLLWIPNHPPLWTVSPQAARAELKQIRQTVASLDYRLAPGTVIAAIAALGLIGIRRRLAATVTQMNERITRPRDDSIRWTMRVLGALVLESLPGALLLLAVAAIFDRSTSPSGLLMFNVFAVTALVYLVLDVMRRVAAHPSVGTLHFGWPVAIMNRVHQELNYMLRWWLPLSVMATIANRMTPDVGEEVIGRVLILIALVLIAAHFGGHIVRELRTIGRAWFASTLNRLRVVVIAVFVVSIGAVVYGQVFSARVIAVGIVNSICVGIPLLLTHAVLMRWLRVARRHLRLNELLSQRTQRPAGEEGGSVEEQLADLTDISSDTQQLVNMTTIAVAFTATIWIWGPLLPAFDALTRIELWTSTATVDGDTVVTRITLATVLIVLALGGLTLFAAKRLPALVEIMLRSRTNISSGARYTVSTLLNYVIIGVGIIAGLSALGLKWSQLQWLVAALGVGIGFGLQEIVANFFSGLIILFERPIRVGDIVTIGDKDGTVTKIRIRATTIRDWDGKELLVPNKEFITGRLLNWTLSDAQTRILINVGIAYGSDVERALKLLHDVVIAHPRTLTEPPPLIVFENFGDNALELSARCFLDSVDKRLQVMTELRLAINKAFDEAGIVIAFPQRDVHLDAAEAIRVAIEPRSDAGRLVDGAAEAAPDTRRETGKLTDVS